MILEWHLQPIFQAVYYSKYKFHRASKCYVVALNMPFLILSHLFSLSSSKDCLVSSTGNDNTENGLPASKADTKATPKAWRELCMCTHMSTRLYVHMHRYMYTCTDRAKVITMDSLFLLSYKKMLRINMWRNKSYILDCAWGKTWDAMGGIIHPDLNNNKKTVQKALIDWCCIGVPPFCSDLPVTQTQKLPCTNCHICSMLHSTRTT